MAQSRGLAQRGYGAARLWRGLHAARHGRLALGLIVLLVACAGVWLRGAEPARALRVIKAIEVHPPGQATGQLSLVAGADRDPPRGGRLSLRSADGGRARILSLEAFYNIWDISAGDVDGDGREEVGVCTYSQTARDPTFARRFFVYAWTDDGDLRPLWRGSRLCRPYVSAQLMDMTGDARAELVSVETTPSGAQLLVAYQWNQFGFWGLGTSRDWREVRVLGPHASSGLKGVLAVVVSADGSRWPTLFQLRDEALAVTWQGPQLGSADSVTVEPDAVAIRIRHQQGPDTVSRLP
jgi:hypothetical protein